MKARKQLALLVIMAAVLVIAAGFAAAQEPKPANPAGAQSVSAAKSPDKLENLTAAEFARLVRELSEEGGPFRSDNFTSNETAYLTVVDTLRRLGASGGAYLGVGPEQNFTYIAKVRPKIAFIVDIRRQAIIQHLMYKAVFHLSSTRAQFLSKLLSKPLPKDKVAGADVQVADLVNYFSEVTADDKNYNANLAAIRKMIVEDFQFPLTEIDHKSLEYVYQAFRNEGLDISYRIGDQVSGLRRGNYPTLKDLITQTDLNGKPGNFLASNEDYEF